MESSLQGNIVLFFDIQLNIILLSTLRLPNLSVRFRCSDQILYEFLFYRMRATFPVHLILLNWIFLIIRYMVYSVKLLFVEGQA